VDYRKIPMECANRQNGIARLSEENGAESFFLGFEAPVSFRPFLDRAQTAIEHQFQLEFRAIPGGHAGLESIFVSTAVPGVELISVSMEYVCRAPPIGTAKFLSEVRLR
jgi:hypothetical protein